MAPSRVALIIFLFLSGLGPFSKCLFGNEDYGIARSEKGPGWVGSENRPRNIYERNFV